MLSIDKINFDKLKPYKGKTDSSFEQLCYQIAKKEYGHLGQFTSIDGSGGDGGVEFYLNLDNGEIWGWQCKFFGDTGRLNVGNRKGQIKNSLETACRNHSRMTKWFLCLKTDLTADSISPTGKKTEGELSWFMNELIGKIPNGRELKLEYWGHSEILAFLKSPKQIGIRNFFFGEVELYEEWFQVKFEENFEKVKDKYDPDLHVIDEYTQSIIDFFLFDPNYCKLINTLEESLLEIKNKFLGALIEFKGSNLNDPNSSNFLLSCDAFKEHITYVLYKLCFIKKCFTDYDHDSIQAFIPEDISQDFNRHYTKVESLLTNELPRECLNLLDLIKKFGQLHGRFFRNYYHNNQTELHFLADAAKGKTHISCHIAHTRISNKLPAIFITGDKFTNKNDILEALKSILSINNGSIEDFLSALDLYGEIRNIRIPIIIDGLNETTFDRYFSEIWKIHLSSFILCLKKFKHITCITTCRNSYAQRIWEETPMGKFHYLGGFDSYDTVFEATQKYFSKYGIIADTRLSSLDRFKSPIFLRIFCELKNPNWGNKLKVDVNLEEDHDFDIFDAYLSQINKRVTNSHPSLRYREPFVESSLASLALYLWNKNLREVSIDEFYRIIDRDSLYEKDKSKAEILINEGLVITRDTRDDSEYICFTYDVLAGYIISKELLKENQDLAYFTSSDFFDKITKSELQHPLYEDIISSLCLLLPRSGAATFVHNLIYENEKIDLNNKYVKYVLGLSIKSIFKLPGKYIMPKEVELVSNLFKEHHENIKVFFTYLLNTINNSSHPLNANYLSKLLAAMKMNERDINWTEFVRKNSTYFEDLINEFKQQLTHFDEVSQDVIERYHLTSRVIMWLLSTTDRALRDEATHALYHYGRKAPKKYSLLVYESLSIDDPYIWERTLASLYGVVMAEHNSIEFDDFRNNQLPKIAKTIYNLIFDEKAPYSTTHILARDYARRIVEISLLYHPNLLSAGQIKDIRPPYLFGGNRELGEFDYEDKALLFSHPIHMDFSNYTIGYLVAGGHSYSDPPEKVKVRKQIYWRIFDLGWSKDLFEHLDNELENPFSRGKRAKIERYGKKYSWIAYYENAGLRDDLGLLKHNEDSFRFLDSDIDPSFPEKTENKLFIQEDFLGDRATPLVEWYTSGEKPNLDKYLLIDSLNNYEGEWLCLDGFLVQEDEVANRELFTFVRTILVKEEEYDKILVFLKNEDSEDKLIPDKNSNYNTFAGELYCMENSVVENTKIVEFKVSQKKVIFKKGEEGYFYIPKLVWLGERELGLSDDAPEQVERLISETQEFEILLPVMEYSWEDHNCHLNQAGGTTVIAQELVNSLNLINQPQTFDLVEQNGRKASIEMHYHKNFNCNHNFIYFRRDLLDNFLKNNKLKPIWYIWGERNISTTHYTKQKDKSPKPPFDEYQVFRSFVEYHQIKGEL